MKKTRGCIALLLLLCISFSMVHLHIQPASAAEVLEKTEDGEEVTEQDVSGVLKVMVTGDLHGQVTAMNYETGEEEPDRGLSKLTTLISEECEGSESETVLLDAGDTLYSYETDFFYNYNEKLIQPIYQAMELLDYDAITLGNHELDYPWEYIMKQLEGSELYDKLTVSNLVYDDTGESVLAPSVTFSKLVMMSDGTEQVVTVGVVGATRQSLSPKRQRYSGFLYGMDIYDSVSAEAKRLKEDGVDVVIALIHGGIGLISSDATVSPGAKLAKLEQIDAVVTAHTHEEFPTSTDDYKAFSYVDEENGLIYGKPVVAVGSHAENLGVIEFDIQCDEDGKVFLASGSARLVPVQDDTKESKEIVKLFERFERYLNKKGDQRSYELAEDVVLTNIDAVISDSALYQLINNAKISYGMSYIQEYLPDYADYPVIAVTKNDLDNRDDYIKIVDEISASDVAKVIGVASSERPSGYVYLYKITGANLREWLEYSVSIYAKEGTRFSTILPNFTEKNKGVSTLLNEDYLKDWSMLFAFDGISYEVDLSQPARFRSDGIMISYKNHRISSLKYQGKEVTDKQEFIIVSDTYEKNFWFMPSESDSIYANFPYMESKEVVLDYLTEQAKYGPIDIKADNNWHLKDAEGYEFAFGTLYGTVSYGKKQDWYYKHVQGARSGLQFFWGKYVTRPQELSVELARCLSKETGGYVPVKVGIVSIADGAEIKEIKYRKGFFTEVDDPNWTLATKISGNVFNVSNNGVYSVLVKDTAGNSTIAHISIDNISPSIIVAVPSVEVVTNRKRSVEGVALPNSTVWVESSDGTCYNAKADANGKYSVPIDPQAANSYIKVWTVEGTRESEKVEVMVYRTGPNLPTANPVKAGSKKVYCFLEENQTPAIIIGKNVYIAEGMSERYKKSGVYNSSYTIVESTVKWLDETRCYISVPKMQKGTKYYLYAFDWQNRESLRTEFVVE